MDTYHEQPGIGILLRARFKVNARVWPEPHNVAADDGPAREATLARSHHRVRVDRTLLETAINYQRVHSALPQTRLLVAHVCLLVSRRHTISVYDGFASSAEGVAIAATPSKNIAVVRESHVPCVSRVLMVNQNSLCAFETTNM